MRNKLSEFIIEIIIFFIGSFISIIGLVIPDGEGVVFSGIAFVITLSTDIVIISIKYYIKAIIDNRNLQIEKMVTSFFNCCFENMLHNDVIDERWREKTKQTLDEFTERMQGLYGGVLLLKNDEIFFYQNELIKKTQKSLDAIHIANSVESLELWDPERSENSKFKRASFYACKELEKSVKKRRLFIIDKQLETDNKDLINRVVCSQTKDLNFEVKKIYIEDLRRGYKMPYDIIISDNIEAIEIMMRFNKVESAYSYINKDKVKRAVSEFQRLWDIADGFERKKQGKRYIKKENMWAKVLNKSLVNTKKIKLKRGEL